MRGQFIIHAGMSFPAYSKKSRKLKAKILKRWLWRLTSFPTSRQANDNDKDSWLLCQTTARSKR